MKINVAVATFIFLGVFLIITFQLLLSSSFDIRAVSIPFFCHFSSNNSDCNYIKSWNFLQYSCIINSVPKNDREANINNRIDAFFKSEEGIELRVQLIEMTHDERYNTRTTYSTADKAGITFVEKHMRYMSLYPNLNFQQYMLNLKLKTKVG